MKLITLENLKNFWKDVKSYVDNGLSKKADSSHGTHVSYGTINGKAPGTPSAGTSSKVAREDHVHPVQTTVSGNAGTATKLATARTINGTSFDGTENITTANWGTARNIQIGNAVKSVNGSGNVTWNWSEMQVPRAYSSSYSFGGNQNAITTAQFITMLTDLGAFSQPHWVSRGSWSYASNQYINDTGCGNIHLAGCVVEVFGNTNAYTIKVTTPTTSSSGVTNGDFIYVNNGSNYSPGWRRLYSTAYKPTASEIGAAAASHTHNYAGSSSAGGNANAAVKLATARTINGTSFDGSANITTANWGTARNITIGNTAKSVNGSANVSWSLSEIGAAPAGYGLGTTCQDKSNQDCNNILVTGFYMGSNMTNKPSGCTQGWIYLLVMRHNDSWVRQVAYDFGTASQVYTRVKQNGSWTAWVATDTNTWRGVQDNLTSTATDQSLSANQGKVLKSLIDGKAASNHTHSYVPLANGGNITIHADSDSSSTGEYALIKAGHNELKIASSAGGTTVTKEQDKLTFNGNIVYHAGRKPTISEIGAAASNHTHGLVNLNSEAFSGGNDLNTYNSTKTWVARTLNSTTNKPADYFTVVNFGANSNSNFQLAHSYANNSTLYVRGRHDTSGNYTPWAKIYTDKNKPTASEIGAAAASHTHNYAGSSSAGGAANSATKLATARTINGTNFDGSANITTANWGTARTLTIGNTGKSVNGSGDISWSLSEIGAASTAAATTSSNGLMTSSMVSTLNTASSRASDWDTFKANGGTINGNLTAVQLATKSPSNNYRWAEETHNTGYKIISSNTNPSTGDWREEFIMAYDGFAPKNDKVLGTLENPWNDIFIKGVSKNNNGYTKLPNGMILQWGEYYEGNLNHSTFFFPISFPNKCISVQLTTVSTNKNYAAVKVAEYTNSQVTINNNICPVKYTWIAIGY